MWVPGNQTLYQEQLKGHSTIVCLLTPCLLDVVFKSNGSPRQVFIHPKAKWHWFKWTIYRPMWSQKIVYKQDQTSLAESEKPRQRVSNADRKVFCESGKFLQQAYYLLENFRIFWKMSGYCKNIQIICKVSGWTGKFPGDLKSVGMNWKVSIWCKKCPDNLKNVSGYSKKGLDDVEMYLENLEGFGWS